MIKAIPFRTGDTLTTEYLVNNAAALIELQNTVITKAQYPLRIVDNTMLSVVPTTSNYFWAKLNYATNVQNPVNQAWYWQYNFSEVIETIDINGDKTFMQTKDGGRCTDTLGIYALRIGFEYRKVPDSSIVLIYESSDTAGNQLYLFNVANPATWISTLYSDYSSGSYFTMNSPYVNADFSKTTIQVATPDINMGGGGFGGAGYNTTCYIPAGTQIQFVDNGDGVSFTSIAMPRQVITDWRFDYSDSHKIQVKIRFDYGSFCSTESTWIDKDTAETCTYS